MKFDKSRFPNVTFVSDQLDMTVSSGFDAFRASIFRPSWCTRSAAGRYGGWFVRESGDPVLRGNGTA
jgi:hypothetical protein